MATIQIPNSSEPRRASVASQSFFKLGDVNDKYVIGKVIGTGNYAEVRHAIDRDTGEEVAIKILSVGHETAQDILNEIDILARVNDHPHVVQLRGIYDHDGRMYIVMELVTGGELFERIVARQSFSERDARDLLFVLIQTISHMHSFGIVHRDLKPENILYAHAGPNAPIKIADFGLAKLSQCDLKTLCGTPGYVAPEVLKNRHGYTNQCDMWSIGVILYVLLCGYPPFQHEQQNKLFKQILKADYQFHSPWWDKISNQAKDLVRRLLVVDPLVRLTPQEALQHPWMNLSGPGASVDVSKLDEYVTRIHKRKFRTLKNALVVAKMFQDMATSSDNSNTSNGAVPEAATQAKPIDPETPSTSNDSAKFTPGRTDNDQNDNKNQINKPHAPATATANKPRGVSVGARKREPAPPPRVPALELKATTPRNKTSSTNNAASSSSGPPSPASPASSSSARKLFSLRKRLNQLRV